MKLVHGRARSEMHFLAVDLNHDAERVLWLAPVAAEPHVLDAMAGVAPVRENPPQSCYGNPAARHLDSVPQANAQGCYQQRIEKRRAGARDLKHDNRWWEATAAGHHIEERSELREGIAANE